MKTHSDVLVDGDDLYLSLKKLVVVGIRDVYGYVTPDLGTVFKVCRIVFDDGREIGFEATHDLPYLSTFLVWPVPELEEDSLNHILKTEPPEEE